MEPTDFVILALISLGVSVVVSVVVVALAFRIRRGSAKKQHELERKAAIKLIEALDTRQAVPISADVAQLLQQGNIAQAVERLQ